MRAAGGRSVGNPCKRGRTGDPYPELSDFSRTANAQEFQRRGVEQARAVASTVDGMEREQSLVDFQCLQAVRFLGFPHTAEHSNAIGKF